MTATTATLCAAIRPGMRSPASIATSATTHSARSVADAAPAPSQSSCASRGFPASPRSAPARAATADAADQTWRIPQRPAWPISIADSIIRASNASAIKMKTSGCTCLADGALARRRLFRRARSLRPAVSRRGRIRPRRSSWRALASSRRPTRRCSARPASDGFARGPNCRAVTVRTLASGCVTRAVPVAGTLTSAPVGTIRISRGAVSCFIRSTVSTSASR